MTNLNELYPGNFFHETVVVASTIGGLGVRIGTGNYFGPYMVISEGVVIGNENRFEGHSSIGSPAEHKSYLPTHIGYVTIGDRNIIKEFVTVNRPTTDKTVIGNGCYIMARAHVSHDTILENGVTLSDNVLLGGHSHVMAGATLGLGAIVHQYQVIGTYAMIGMGSVITKGLDVLPGRTYAGNPAKFLGRNTIGIARAGVSPEHLDFLTREYRLLRDKTPISLAREPEETK